MRRVLLLAATALLGSGCIVNNDCVGRTITVQWGTVRSGALVDVFTAGDGSLLSCSQAGVAFVDIFMNGTPVDRWNCTDGGATITNVASGSYTLTVEGVEAGGRIAFRDEFPVNSTACGDQLVQAQPGEGWLDVNYAFQGGGSCAANPSYLWFSMHDDVASAVVAQVDQGSAPTQYQCGVYANPPTSIPPNALFLPLPAGRYTLSWIEERIPVTGGFALAGAYCSPTPFTVQAGIVNYVPVTLANAPPATACH
jgi:hypothetical protein